MKNTRANMAKKVNKPKIKKSVKKRRLTQKQLSDSLSETISFVIKGKLTPIKPVVKKIQFKKQNRKVNVEILKEKPKPKNKDTSPKTKTSKVVKEEKQDDIETKETKPITKEIKEEKPKKILKRVLIKSNLTVKKEPRKQQINKSKAPRVIKPRKSKQLLTQDIEKPQKKSETPKKGKSLKKEISPVNIEISPAKREASPAKREISPGKKETSAVKREASPVKKDIPPAKREVCPVKREVSPVKREVSPGKREVSPAKREVSPVKTDVSPVKKEVLPVKHEKINIKQETSSIKQDKIAKKPRTTKRNKPKSLTVAKKQMKKPPVAKPLDEIKEKPKIDVIKAEESNLSDDTSTTSDEMTLDLIRKQSVLETKSVQIKKEPLDDKDNKKQTAKTPTKKPVIKKKILTPKEKIKRNSDQKRKLKLFALWNGPKRHRVASLNALAKVHCLYENEGRSIIDTIPPIKRDTADKKERVDKKEKVEKVEKTEKVEQIKEEDLVPARNLRTAPGLRGVGKHWDMHESTSSSSEDTGCESSTEIIEEKPPKKEPVKKVEEKKPPVKRRKRTEVIMDLKDMVVRKRMASLNASAILAASYSLEKNASRSPKSSCDSDTDDSDSYSDDSVKKKYEDDMKKDDKVIEVQATPNKKVAVIVNQDTDVTITGVYVNSTTRSTHHEGYCSIAGMQYRISATSHTQTAATAVATETLLQSTSSSSQENSNGESTPSKSYTPLDALSNMQPPSGPGSQHGVQLPHHHLGPPHISPQLSPLPRRHGCSSAFSAPPGHYSTTHHHPPPPPPPPTLHGEQGYMHGYYQPAGPLINVPHGHTQPPPTLGKSAPLSETSSVSPPPTQPPPAPSSGGDSSDNDVIITSVTNAKDASPPQQPYRLGQYPTSAHSTYPYGYPTHYYHAPHPTPPYPHHDLCYSPNTYLHKSYPPYRRYLTVGPPPNAQYFQPSPPDLYNPPPAPPPPATQQNQQVVTATSSAAGSANSYQAPPNGPPPAPPTILESYPPQQPPTLVESYPPPYYAGYGPPPPPCYSHSPTRSSLPYINATYQNCPCPIQSCPKNVHTGPLIGNNKRSNISSITKDSILLQPVALALPMEPASATGPPSPARGSAGMPPPPSPAGATYQAPPTPKRETPEPADLKSIEKRRKPARVGKSAVRETLHQNTMLLMCQEQEPPTSYLNGVKREVESPKEDSKKEIIPHEVVSKVEATNVEEKVAKVTIMIQEAKIETLIEPEKPVQCLKEEKVDVVSVVKDVASPQVPPQAPPVVEQLEPCVKTVAENVKVKNMKRKPSITKEEPSPKKQKIEKSSGSYKDLIRKNYAAVQITNGKRKLLSRSILQNSPKIRFKKPQTKRKHSPVKEVETKKLKPSKPLTACNHNSKLTMKEKEKAYVEADLIENKEPSKKIGKKTLNTKCKKIAPAALDNLISMNSVDRTIESVISENNNTTRTLKNGTNATTLRTFGGKFNSKVKPEIKKEHNNVNKKSSGNSNNNNNVNAKIISIRNNKFSECKKIGAAKRKTKCKSADMTPQIISRVPRKSLLLPRWSNGWEWKGEPFEGKVFLNSDEATVIRKCYPAMIHSEGDIIAPRDSVLLKAGPRKNDLPFVARIAALWENPEDGEMMMSLLWYYRPEHTEQGRLPTDQRDEVFASRHKDSNSVACIEDKCYVLTYNEYCRLRKNFRKLKEEAEERLPSIPLTEIYNGLHRQPPMTAVTPPEMIFFCRRVYDFRQKRIVKNPS